MLNKQDLELIGKIVREEGDRVVTRITYLLIETGKYPNIRLHETEIN